MFFALTLIFGFAIIHGANGARILVVPGHSIVSHTKSMYPLAETLSQHGHDVVVLQILKYEKHKAKASKGSKIEDRFLVVPLENGESPIPPSLPSSLLWGNQRLDSLGFFFPWKLCTDLCKSILDSAELGKEFYSIVQNEKWDLVIVDDIFTPCGMLAAMEAKRSSNASIINFGTTMLMTESQEARGLTINKAVYPSNKPPNAVFDHRQFWQRLNNAFDYFVLDQVLVILDYLIPRWMEMPQSASTSPSIFAYESDMLMGSLSPLLEFSKPMANDIIELDLDCPAKAQLTDSYSKFVDDPKSKGTIVFAMGHATDWDGAPVGVVESFLEAFDRLSDYRIVWQYVSQLDKPSTKSHLILDKWVPQSALLYHSKTKVFISHMGGKSLREAICAGVPVVAMPMFAEQYRNAAITRKKNVGTFLDKTNLSPQIIFDAITEILNNTSHEDNMKLLRAQLDDRIMPPMQLGRFWSEFLIKRKSSTDIRKYFRLRASKLSRLAIANADITVLSVFLALLLAVTVC